jgi:hypothetical protein
MFSDGPYVAWLDVLGVSELYRENRDVAIELWRHLYRKVKEFLPRAGKGAKVYGINDGCFIRTGDLEALLDFAVRLYQCWFDEAWTSDEPLRPFIRGGITRSADDIELRGRNIPVWLLGPGFIHASKYESILRGGRLFLDPLLAEQLATVSEMRYDWYDLSEFGKANEQAQASVTHGVEVIEWLWPLALDDQTILDRLEAAQNLYGKSLDENSVPLTNPHLSQKQRVLLHREEAFKTCIRAAGAYLAKHKSRKLIYTLDNLLEYRADRIFFTWGVSFLALEAIFRGGIEDSGEYVKKSINFVSNNGDRHYRQDYVTQLSKKTYTQFGQWVRRHSEI